MGRNEEDFARGLGYKISSVPLNSNKFRNNCVDCGRNVFAGEGHMVKGEEHDKIKTLCRVCRNNWVDKSGLNNSIVMKNLHDLHWSYTEGKYKTIEEQKNG